MGRVLGEDVAPKQPLVVLLQRVERFVEAARHLRHVLQLLGGQGVDVLVDRIARVDPVLDAVEPGHHHRAEREVRVAARVGEAHLDAARLRVRPGDGDAHARRAVAARVGQVHRRLEARHQAPVRVRRRVRQRRDRLRVLDDAADVVERRVREARVAVAAEEGLALLPQRLVHVHPLPLSPKSGLGMNVAALPCLRATFFTTYLNHISWSAQGRAG